MTEEVAATPAVEDASPDKAVKGSFSLDADISWIKTHALMEAKDLWLSIKKLGPLVEQDVNAAVAEILALAKKLEAHFSEPVTKTPPAA